MHYRQKTSFMSLYEELSKLYEAETAPVLDTFNTVSNEKLDSMLRDYTRALKKICGTAAQNVVIFLTRSFSSNICRTGSIARSCLAGSEHFSWHYIENHSAIATSNTRKIFGDSLASSEIDLTGSWIAFNFLKSTLDSNMIAKELSRTLNLPEDDAAFIQPCVALGTKIYKNGMVTGVAFPYTADADERTLLNFCSLMPANTTSFADFEQAKEFIKEFTDEYPDRIQYNESGRPSAIHIPSLVTFYMKHLNTREAIRSMLSIYFKPVTFEPNLLQPWKSVQYLYNAIQQEAAMKSILKPNDAATNAGTDIKDSNQYLISGKASTATDFVYKVTLGGDTLNIDAKQGHYMKGESVKINNSHNADYIVYFAYEGLGDKSIGLHDINGKWFLYRATEETDLYVPVFESASAPDTKNTDTEKQLLTLLAGLNTTLTLVNLKSNK